MYAADNFSSTSQTWSWKLCLLVATIAVTLDILLVQFPLVWLGAAAIIAVLAQFRSPISGLAVVIFTCGLANYSPFETGALSRLYAGNVAMVIFLVAWFASGLSSSLKSLFPASLINKPLWGMALVVPLSMLWSRLHPDPEVTYAYPHSDISWATAQLSEILLLGITLCIPFAVAAAIRRWKDVETIVILVGGLVAIGTVLTIGGLVFGYGGSYSILGIRRAYWGEPWDASIEPLSALCLPFLFSAVMFGRRSLSHYRLIFVLFAFCLLGLALTFSRETWLLGLCGLLLVFGAWLRSRVNPALALVIVTFGAVILVLSGIIGAVSDFYNPDQVYGLERIYYYATALQLFATHPVLGVGAGNYQFFDRSYEGNAAGGIAHNQFLTTAAETGLAGLLLFLWLVRRLLQIRKQLRSQLNEAGEQNEWLRVAGSAFLLVWIAECFFQEAFFATASAGGGTHVLTVIVFPWIFMGILLASHNLNQHSSISEV